MFGLFRRSEEPAEASELSFEALLAQASELAAGLDVTFEQLLGDASQLRKAVWAKLDELPWDEKATVLSHIHELSVDVHKREGISPATLPFGSLHALSFDQSTLLVDEISHFVKDAEEQGNKLQVLAGAYCLSMAMACVAGGMEKSLEQELEFINLKHEFGQQTGMLVDSLEQAWVFAPPTPERPLAETQG